MNEADGEYTALQHHATCWRTARKLFDDAAVGIEKRVADRLMICWEALEGLRQLAAADAAREFAQESVALQTNKQLSQLHLEHRAKSARHVADRSTVVLTLLLAALAEGQQGRWPSLFPPQVHTSGHQVDGNYAVLRGYLAAELEYANRLPFFRSLTEPASLIAAEVNRVGGVAGRLVKGNEIINWRRRVRSKSTPEDDIAKQTYGRVLAALLALPERPRSKAAAISILRNQMLACPAVDPRRATEKQNGL